MKFPLPFLLFTDARGLDLPSFVTLRLGSAWARRLKKDDRVLLAHKHEIIGDATVGFVDAGPADVMLLAHAHASHLEQSMQLSEGLDYSYDLAPQRRMESMLKTYGPAKFKPQSLITVIRLLR